jgi:threonine dehydratase
LVITGDRYAEALAASEQWASESGAMSIHAYDQRETLLGQGSVGLEFEAQAPDLDTILVAVGGGGLIGGVAAWYGGRVRVIGVEPENAPTLTNALAAGRPVDSPAGGIAADSLAPKRVGELMFPIAQSWVDRVLLVSDEAIQDAPSRTLGSPQDCGRTRRSGRLRRALFGSLQTGAFRTGWGDPLRREPLKRVTSWKSA